jgi:DNA-binding transcriptional MerR regulator
MRIGELARRSGLAATTLRDYEKAGLLPRSPRTASGYRTYEADALPRLAFIRAAQAVGLTIAEIREVVGIRDAGRAPCLHVLALLDRHRAEVQARMRELRQLERDLTCLADAGAGLDPAQYDPTGICEIIPQRPTRDDRSHRRVASVGEGGRWPVRRGLGSKGSPGLLGSAHR